MQGTGPLMFQPPRIEVDAIPLETHNAVVKELEETKNELLRARQKISHLLREIEELKTK